MCLMIIEPIIIRGFNAGRPVVLTPTFFKYKSQTSSQGISFARTTHRLLGLYPLLHSSLKPIHCDFHTEIIEIHHFALTFFSIISPSLNFSSQHSESPVTGGG